MPGWSYTQKPRTHLQLVVKGIIYTSMRVTANKPSQLGFQHASYNSYIAIAMQLLQLHSYIAMAPGDIYAAIIISCSYSYIKSYRTRTFFNKIFSQLFTCSLAENIRIVSTQCVFTFCVSQHCYIGCCTIRADSTSCDVRSKNLLNRIITIKL